MARKQVSFDALRALLYDPPSKLTWRRLWRLLSRAELSRLEDELLPYVRGHLVRWPGGLRDAPSRAVKALLGGADVRLSPSEARLMSLIDHLDLPQKLLSQSELVALVGSPYGVTWTHLTLNLFKVMYEDWGGELQDDEPMPGVWELARSEHLSGVRHLALHSAHLRSVDADALLSAPWFQSLESLKLVAVTVRGEVTVPAITPRLSVLSVDNGNASSLASAWAKPESAHALRHLSVHAAWVSSEGFEAWVKPSRSGGLETLSMSQTDVSVLQGVVERPEVVKGLRGLRELSLVHAGGTPQALGALLRSPPWEALRSLDVSRHYKEPSVIDELRKADTLKGLKRLTMDYVPICGDLPEDDHLDAFLSASWLSGLESLSVRAVGLRGGGLERLLACEGLSSLRSLDVSRNSRVGVRALAAFKAPSPALSGLRQLGLTSMKVDDEVLGWIEANPALSGLASLELYPADLSLQKLYEVMRADRLAGEGIIKVMKRASLLASLKSLGVKVPGDERTLPLLRAHLRRVLYDSAELSRFLSGEQVMGLLGKRSLNATMRAAGLRGYSKMSFDQIKAALKAHFGVEGQGLGESASGG